MFLIDPYRFAIPWTPAQVSTALWLDAADATTVLLNSSAVTQWNDKSGNGRNVSQSTAGNRPTYSATGFNSKGALSFNGSSNFLQGAASITTGTYTGQFNLFWVGTRSGNGGVIISERSSALVGRSQWFASGPNYIISSDGQNTTSNNLISSTTLNLIQSSGGIAFHQHASGSRDILFINGTQQAVTSGTAGNITGGTSYFRIGAAEGSAGAYWNGSLCEVLVIASSVSTANRQTIEGYLAHKWGLSSSLPSDHPYKSAPPTV